MRENYLAIPSFTPQHPPDHLTNGPISSEETQEDMCDGVRFMQGVLTAAFFSLFLWAAIIWAVL